MSASSHERIYGILNEAFPKGINPRSEIGMSLAQVHATLALEEAVLAINNTLQQLLGVLTAKYTTGQERPVVSDFDLVPYLACGLPDEPGGVPCTEKEGHRGPHRTVASDGTVLRTWPQKTVINEPEGAGA